jgi:Zn-dependent M28 family amino/carboxypeptidase
MWIFVPLLVIGTGVWFLMLRMPGAQYSGVAAALTGTHQQLRDSLRVDVERLSGEIGERNLVRYDALTVAASYLQQRLTEAGYKVARNEFEVATPNGQRSTYNLIAELRGAQHPEEIVVVGAHYDSKVGNPGADDNASGSAGVLALARAFSGKATPRTLRFVLFTNEEPPYYHQQSMGSLVYAKLCRARNDEIVAMLSLETIGYFSDSPGSQKYPFPVNLFYPSIGNFIGFVGNVPSRGLVRDAIRSFRQNATVPSQGLAAPAFIEGVDWSDQWSFWEQGYPGIMVTDTAPNRNPHYHQLTDTPEKLDYDRLARVVLGLESVVRDLVKESR